MGDNTTTLEQQEQQEQHVEEQETVFVGLSATSLSLDDLMRMVATPKAGAISTFSGVTRDSFEGKRVVQLEYEAYSAMAEKSFREICNEALSKYQCLKAAIYHRTGVVPVGEASVLIAISSAHRAAAMHAVEYAIDELKARSPVWKKEVYEDGSMWKANKEFQKPEPSHHHK